MNVRALRSWLLIRPRAASLKLKIGEKTQEILTDSDQNWARLADSIEVLAPDTIEAYAADGRLLRATKGEAFDDEDEAANEEAALNRAKLAADSETERYRVFADHIAGAYKFATEIAFERMVDLFAAVNRRSEMLEKSLEQTHRLLGKAYQEQVDQALEHAGNADPITELVGAFVQGNGQAQAEQAAAMAAEIERRRKNAANGKSNGKPNGKAEA